MKERISLRLCSSFVYLFFMKFIFASTIALNESIIIILFYFLIATLMTIFLEAFHYLMIDMIKYTKVIICVILLLSIGILYFQYSSYYLVILIYIDFVMINDLLKSYKMYKSLIEFQSR